MAEIATGYITVIPSMEGCQTSIEAALSGVDTTSIGKSYGSNLSDGVESMFAGIGSKILSTLGSAVSAAISVVTDSIDDAISRVDTLNQFPKIMENLGYSADDAAASLDKMSDSIQGLPTTLDDIVSNVTSLAAVTGDLDYATDITIAMNDAMLMFGASTDGVSSGITQLSQMLAKGTVDMQSWNVINSNAPGLLDKVAQAMLGEAATSTTLYTALQDGTVSLDEFCDELIYLDQNGTESMASFSQGVQDATGGIETSFTNISTAVTRNVAKVITELDSEEGHFSNMSQVCIDAINALGDMAASATADIVDGFERMYATWKETGSIAESLCAAFDKTDSSMATVSNTTIEMSAALTALPATVLVVITSFESMIAVMEKKILKMTECKTMYELLGKTMKTMCNPVNLVVTAITALVAIFAVCWNSSEDFQESIKGIISSIGDSLQPVLETLSEVLADVGESLMPVVNEMFDILVDVFGELFIVAGNVLEALMPIVADVLQVAIPLVGDLIELLMTMLLPVLESIETVLDFVFTLVDAGFDLLDILINVALIPIENVLEVLTPTINLVADALQLVFTIAGAILEILIDFLTFNWADIPNVISETSNKICDITTDMANTVTGNTKAVDDAVDEMAEDFSRSNKAIETSTQMATETVTVSADRIVETIDEASGEIVETVESTSEQITIIVNGTGEESEEEIAAVTARMQQLMDDYSEEFIESLEELRAEIADDVEWYWDASEEVDYATKFASDGSIESISAWQYTLQANGEYTADKLWEMEVNEEGWAETTNLVTGEIINSFEDVTAGVEYAEHYIGDELQGISGGFSGTGSRIHETTDDIELDMQDISYEVTDTGEIVATCTDAMEDDSADLQAAFEYLAEKSGVEMEHIVADVEAMGGSINNEFVNADGMLTYQGYLIIRGLGDGMVDEWNNEIAPWLSSLNSQIPNLKGPEKRDANMLVNAGELIIGGLGDGMLDAWDDVEDILDDMTDELSDWGSDVEPFDVVSGDLATTAAMLDASGTEFTDDGEPIYISIENMEVRSDDDIEAVSRELYRLIRRKGAMAA